ncbi:MAG TPA: NAD-dependent epimerase [Candidatus Bathyarchaeia archaeon]|nr:NAD-dependent epimerase [Candidatus Bathyarchaeia archaeon]
MKVLVTGAAGFIGFHLAERLAGRGDEVVGLDNINDYYDVGLKHGRLRAAGIDPAAAASGRPVASAVRPNYRFVKLDLEDRDGLERLFAAEGFAAVGHMAAQAGVRYSLINPHAYVASNLAGFVNVIEASRARQVGHFVYASSASVYGLNESLPFSTRDNVDHPVSLYAASKKSNELMAHCYSHLFGLPTTGLRFFTVYGPWGRPDMAYFLFTKAILEGRPIEVFNHGDMRRDLTYVDDIVEGVVRILDRPPAGDPDWTGRDPDPSRSRAPYRVYNIGNGRPVGLTELIAAIETSLGRKAEVVLRPMQPGDVPVTWADTSDIVKDFGFRPSTPVGTGIARFTEWYLGWAPSARRD